MEPGTLIDQLYAARSKRLKLEQQVKEAKKKEAATKDLIFAEFDRLKLETAGGKKASASSKWIEVPEVIDAEKDWPKLWAYIQKHGTFEMLHKRLSAEPFQERHARGESVPGVTMVKVRKLNLTARKK